MERFLRDENNKLSSMLKDLSAAMWNVNTTGEEKWQNAEMKAEKAYRQYVSDKERFEKLKAYRKEAVKGSLEARQVERLYQDAFSNQLSSELIYEMVQLSSTLSNQFNTFRAKVDGKEVTENVIRETLLTSTNMKQRENVWHASKQIGKEVEQGLLKLVKLRNKAAQSLGYKDHYEMSFELAELDLQEVFTIFNDLIRQTNEPFQRVKAEIDDELRQQYGIADEVLYPWHYHDPFFQEAPSIPGTELTDQLKGKNIEQLTIDTFSSLGMEIRDLLAKSDLYERPNKNQHAFCLDMDRKGDVRVLCNIQPNQYWLETMLHEFGHAVYDKYVDRDLPFLLRTHAHIFTTEAVAMFFGRMAKEEEWLHKFMGLSKEKLASWMPLQLKMQQRKMLIMARWIITFVFFERELYRDPDQNLNKLWWKLVNEIQGVEPPKNQDYPHWAAKIHFTIAPVYYQNYLLGELMASQMHYFIQEHVSSEIFTEQTGQFFIQKIFQPGDRTDWRGLVEGATKEALNPAYFVNQFVL
jgi:peptidyl-dipeptidase A